MPSLDVQEFDQRLSSRDLADILKPEADALQTDRPARGDCVDLLARMVEGEIIPRLLLVSRARPEASPEERASPAFSLEEIEAFAQSVLASDSEAVIAQVSVLLEHGASIQAIYMDLLAPVARRLGEYWTADYCSFSDVTIALGKLQQVLHRFGGRDMPTALRPGRSALFAAAPGEQHTLGLLLIEDIFRRAAWSTWCESSGSAPELARLAAGQWFDLFGVSVSCDARLDEISAVISAVRRASKNRAIRVMVGGRIFSEHPELAREVGADVTAVDGYGAVAAAESALMELEGRV